MSKRLRALLLSLIAFAAAGLFSVGGSGPAAHADAGTTCLHPSLSGQIGVAPAAEYGSQATYTSTVASTSAACAAPTFFTAGYRYTVSFFPWPSEYDASVNSAQFTRTRVGTNISFPNTSVPLTSNYPDATYIKIVASRYNNSFGAATASETQYYRVWDTGSYNTASLSQVASPTSCSSNGIPGPIVGGRSFCP